ncbi:hypothetical protein J6590_054570 [Homalodisca vitripennis]|nr:hypothetical protein J6590_054570 [Homalodisca vitripennis]
MDLKELAYKGLPKCAGLLAVVYLWDHPHRRNVAASANLSHTNAPQSRPAILDMNVDPSVGNQTRLLLSLGLLSKNYADLVLNAFGADYFRYLQTSGL